jgi:hypothetical protein
MARQARWQSTTSPRPFRLLTSFFASMKLAQDDNWFTTPRKESEIGLGLPKLTKVRNSFAMGILPASHS